MKNQIDWNCLREGAELCLVNSRRLILDAGCLFRNERYLSSIILSVYSIEEAGKAALAFDSFQRKENVTYELWKTKFLKHTSKIFTTYKKLHDETSSIYPLLDNIVEQIASTVKWANSTKTFYEKLSAVLQEWKKYSIYVDYDFKKKQWIEPTRFKPMEGFLVDPKEISRGLICWAVGIITTVEKILGKQSRDLEKLDDIFL